MSLYLFRITHVCVTVRMYASACDFITSHAVAHGETRPLGTRLGRKKAAPTHGDGSPLDRSPKRPGLRMLGLLGASARSNATIGVQPTEHLLAA